MDINKRLNDIMKKRGWTRYKLAKMCNLHESTLSNIFYRGTTPSIPTLEIICKTMNITLSDLFAEDDRIEVDAERKELLLEINKLSPEKRKHLLQTIKYMQ